MNTQSSKMPSREDFLVHRRIRVEGTSAAATAAELHLTAVQVAQATDRVNQYLLEISPKQNGTLAERERAVSQFVVFQQAKYAYNQALEAYCAEQEERVQIEIRFHRDKAPQTKITVAPERQDPDFVKFISKASADLDRMRNRLIEVGWDPKSPLLA